MFEGDQNTGIIEKWNWVHVTLWYPGKSPLWNMARMFTHYEAYPESIISGLPDAAYPGVSYIFPGLSPLQVAKTVKDISISSATNTFVESFTQVVYCSDTLTQLFDFSEITALQYSRFVYRYAEYWLTRWCTRNVYIAAEFATRPLINNFCTLPLDTMVRAFSNIMARFIYFERILTLDNAEEFGLAYAKAIEESAKRNLKGTTDSKFLSIGEGFVDFATSVLVMTPKRGWRLAMVFGEGWLLEAIMNGPFDFYITHRDY
ncbi:uncharacterized protein NPIL_295201 [Nephila pilipes]|uniref:Uncharacterized protein n=1 Tax=Nephila pilipes TaxID=299642 RepID=A0A8X6P4E7_NEPPI|nr:uncharacterized protein NPIL_295201 [Nephila pilipes]